jgi:hypothetical protein
MRKIAFPIALLTLLVLTACANNDALPNFAPTSTEGVPTAAPTAGTEIVGAKPGDCQVTGSIFPPEKGTEWQKFAPINSSDYVQGPENAVMTIIEYSDFT